MRKALKKSIAVLLALVMLMSTLLISTFTASAATPVDLENAKISVWADPEGVLTQAYVDDFSNGTSKSSVLGGIQPYQIASSGSSIGSGGSIIGGGSSSGKGNYYLFLPSNADCSSLTLWLAGSSTLTVDGTTVTSGEPTSVFAELNEGGISKDYTFVLNSTSYTVTVMKSGDVGTVYITTASGSLSSIYSSKDNYEAGTIMVVQPDGSVDYMGAMEKISGRGNGTWSSDNTKNPYNIKLATSTSLLGMSKAKKWCLLASTGSGQDNTLVKNQMTYDFSDYIGIRYQVHCKPVDLYVNQQYLGSYQLAEKVEIKSNRVSITDAFENLELANGTTDSVTGALIPADLTGTSVTKYNPNTTLTTTKNQQGHSITAKNYSPSLTEPNDYTGGYIYELEISERWVEENAGFCAYNRQGWVIKSADYASTNMVNYNYDLLYALGSSVYNKGTVPSTSTTTNCSSLSSLSINVYGDRSINNPAPATEYQGKKWSDMLDADSAVKYYWTQEFFKNMDSSTSSTYFYKDSDSIDGKIYAGPVWDMDNALVYSGNSSRWGYSYTSTDGWYTKNARIYRWRSQDSTMTYSTDAYSPLNFYAALATNCSDFWAMAEDYWFSTISPAVDVLLGNKVDETGKLKSISEYVTTVSKSAVMDAARFSTTYDAASIISSLENWVTNRQTWINNSSGFSTTALSGAIIESLGDYSYTGSEITPKLNITYNDSVLGTVSLTEGVDYTLSYSNNTNVGTATITVTGINGYTGTRNVTFKIVANDLTNATLSIESSQYTNTALTPVLTDASGNDLSNMVTYQWYKDGTAISGATDKTYVTADSDAGSQITVTATGDGTNTINSITSNACTILEGQRPEGFTRTIASWDYDYTADSTTLVNADTTGTGYHYTATGGEAQASANLFASVNATDEAKIKWSGSADLYTNDSNTIADDQSPVMGTSKTDLLAWGAYPYFETVVSTAGYENIHFSAKLGGTKKGPRDWKLQYSLDGTTYTDIEGATYSITTNKVMELAFNDIALPADCDNQQTVYIRMIVTNDIAINGTNTIVNQTSGDAATNNIKVTGASLSVVTELYEPTITSADNGILFDDSNVVITDNNGGADVYYTVNGGEPVLYTGAFNPFDAKSAKVGDSVEISAYAHFNDITSSTVTSTVTFAGVDINSFIYENYSTDVTAGAVQSTGGVYGQSGKMTTYTDGKSQYVPLWRSDNGSFCIAPDDGAKWSENSGFTYRVSTAGYENVNFSCMAYTTNYGPKSITLQYSTDGVNYYNVQSNVALNANAALEQVFLTTNLPAACDNQRVVYIRLVTAENSTFAGTTLHNNESKGNLYVNNVIIAGEDNGELKMPYTNKSTSYFGEIGVIKYVSPDGLPMRYAVIDGKGNTVDGGTYVDTGIQLSTVDGFDKTAQEGYTVIIEAYNEDSTSMSNSATYYYKGSTVVKFNYNDTTKLFTNYVSADTLSVSNTSGVNTGTLAMYPDGNNATALTYTNAYGVKVVWNSNNPFTATKNLDNPDGNGYWLIETSTTGFTDLTLNVEQLSSNSGPRDWGIAYSTDGKSYTYVDNSNARAISNDSSNKPVETYGNLELPSACDNQEKLYIKVFINGGEAVNGTELEMITKGNTGLNGFEISGIPIPYDVEFNTTLLESKGAASGTVTVPNVDIYVNGVLKATTDENGAATLALASGVETTLEFRGDGIAARTVSITANSSMGTQNIPLMAYDVNNDGFVNAKDFAIIVNNSQYSSYEEYFSNFINVKTNEFTY